MVVAEARAEQGDGAQGGTQVRAVDDDGVGAEARPDLDLVAEIAAGVGAERDRALRQVVPAERVRPAGQPADRDFGIRRVVTVELVGDRACSPRR
jgi:hypothetical protein